MNRYFIKMEDGLFDGLFDLSELKELHPEIYNQYMFAFYNTRDLCNVTITYDYEYVSFFMLETRYSKEDLMRLVNLNDVFFCELPDMFNLLGDTWNIIKNKEDEIG